MERRDLSRYRIVLLYRFGYLAICMFRIRTNPSTFKPFGRMPSKDSSAQIGNYHDSDYSSMERIVPPPSCSVLDVSIPFSLQ